MMYRRAHPSPIYVPDFRAFVDVLDDELRRPVEHPAWTVEALPQSPPPLMPFGNLTIGDRPKRPREMSNSQVLDACGMVPLQDPRGRMVNRGEDEPLCVVCYERALWKLGVTQCVHHVCVRCAREMLEMLDTEHTAWACPVCRRPKST